MQAPEAVPQRALTDESEIHAAAAWRLAGWSPETVEQAQLRLTDLMAKRVPLTSGHPEVADFLQSLRRSGERRDPWSALCAVAVFWAEACGDTALYFRAGFEVLGSYRQAARGSRPRSDDALDLLLGEYLRRHPGATTPHLFEHCCRLAMTRVVVVDADEDSLSYCPRPSESTVRRLSRHAFEMRVSRIRRHAAHRDEDPAAGAACLWAWPLLQPVAVRREP